MAIVLGVLIALGCSGLALSVLLRAEWHSWAQIGSSIC